MIEPTQELVRAAWDEIDFVNHTWESVEAAVKAVLAIVERDYLTGCRAILDTRGALVACRKPDDGHDTHVGRHDGWDVVW